MKMSLKCVFSCQNQSLMKCYHIPGIQRNRLRCSGGQSCCWPGWTSEQNSTVKYLNSCMRPLRTQFKPSKYLYSAFFIQLISLSGSCRFRAVPAQVLHLWADCNGKPICSHWCFFFLMKHICVSSIVKHLFSKTSENLRWLPGNKMDVFHHCIHEFVRFFFSNLEGCSCSSV